MTGVLHCVLPLEKQCAEALDEMGVEHPAVLDTTRNPTPCEIRAALALIPGLRARFTEPRIGRSLDAELEADPDQWTSLRVQDYQGEDVSHEFYFSKGPTS